MHPTYREGLPELPDRMKHLPLNAKGYPIPFFVKTVNGVPDFRVLDETNFARATYEGLCHICGGKLGRYRVYAGGPLCALQLISSEPPSHRECAEYAVRACPFLLLPRSKRRTAGLDTPVPEPGSKVVMVEENPGITALLVTERGALPVNGLFRLTHVTEVIWFTEGRAATPDEIREAMIDAQRKLTDHREALSI